MLTSLLRAASAERLKLRRSLALWLALAAPVTILFLQTVLILNRGSDFVGPDTSIWPLLIRQSTALWALLMLPLFVALETALIAGLEHSGNNWKHILALPLPRGAIYTAKLGWSVAIIAFAHCVLAGAIILAGGFIRILQPGIGSAAPLPWPMMWQFTSLSCAGAWLLIAIHLWIAVRWRNFAVAMGIGVAMTVGGVILVSSRWAGYYPWTLPAIIVNAFGKGNLPRHLLLFGTGTGLLVAVLSTWEFARRDF